jgi:hypothetical protein
MGQFPHFCGRCGECFCTRKVRVVKPERGICTRKVRRREGDSQRSGGKVEAPDPFFRRVVGQEGLSGLVDPDSLLEDIDANLWPEHTKLEDGLLDVLLKAPGITVVLGELFAQAGPGDDGLALGAVAAVDEEGEEILELGASLLSLELHPEATGDGDVMTLDVLEEALFELDAEGVFETGNSLLAVFLRLELYGEVIGEIGGRDHGEHDGLGGSGGAALYADDKAGKAAEASGELLDAVSVAALPCFFQIVVCAVDGDEGGVGVDGFVEEPGHEMAVVAVGHIDAIDPGGEGDAEGGPVAEPGCADDLTLLGGPVREGAEDEGLGHLDDFVPEDAGIAVLAKLGHTFYALVDCCFALFGIVATFHSRGSTLTHR